MYRSSGRLSRSAQRRCTRSPMMSAGTGPARQLPGLSVLRLQLGEAQLAARAIIVACKATTHATSTASLGSLAAITPVCGLASTAAPKFHTAGPTIMVGTTSLKARRALHATNWEYSSGLQSKTADQDAMWIPHVRHSNSPHVPKSVNCQLRAQQGRFPHILAGPSTSRSVTLIQVLAIALHGNPGTSHEEKAVARLSGVLGASAFQ